MRIKPDWKCGSCGTRDMRYVYTLPIRLGTIIKIVVQCENCGERDSINVEIAKWQH